MLISGDATLEWWTPDFSSSEQPDPTWIRVKAGDIELCNALDRVEWGDNPVQVRLCESCGHDQCEPGGYVHCTRLSETVVWSAPQLDAPDEWAGVQYEAAHAIRKFGAVAIPFAEWAAWREAAPRLPEAISLEEANGRVLADAWRMSASGPIRVSSLDAIVPMLRNRACAATSLETDVALRYVERMVRWLDGLARRPLRGSFEAPATVGASVEVLYFDGPGEWDWPAFAVVGDRLLPALGSDLVFVPEGQFVLATG